MQPKAVEIPTSTLGRRSTGKLSRIAQTLATDSIASSQLIRIFARLCACEAETGSVTLWAPAAAASWNPRKLGARASTTRPGIFAASRTTAAASAICGRSLGGTNDATSISLKPASARARIHRCFAAVGMLRLMLCSPSRGPTSLTRTRMTRAARRSAR